MSFQDITFDAMGCEVRLLIGKPGPNAEPAATAAEAARRFILEFDATLSRFRPDSELCALNADERVVIPASQLMRDAVQAGVWAAELTDGLIDPTLVEEIEAAGYAHSRAGITPVALSEALDEAPPRHAARPSPNGVWRKFEVDESAGVIRRPRGARFDTGGTGKGLAADLVAERLAGYDRFVVDCGGDIRIGGFEARLQPFKVEIENPLTGMRSLSFRLGSGGVATSGLDVRIWRQSDGSFAHHLLDPATGKPVWSGIVGATAIGATALEAETLAKAALLSGPDTGRRYLARRGGLLVHESGLVERIGPLGAAVVVFDPPAPTPRLEGVR